MFQEPEYVLDEPIFSYWKPLELHKRYKEDRNNKDIQKQFLGHMLKNIARKDAVNVDMKYIKSFCLLLSSHLDAVLSGDQRNSFNSIPKEMNIRNLMNDVTGERAVKKIVKRKLCMILGNINNYA